MKTGTTLKLFGILNCSLPERSLTDQRRFFNIPQGSCQYFRGRGRATVNQNHYFVTGKLAGSLNKKLILTAIGILLNHNRVPVFKKLGAQVNRAQQIAAGVIADV